MTTSTMIEPTQAIVPVTAADREAYLAMNTLPRHLAEDVRAGRWDHTTGMQVLARHGRHTAPAGEVEPVAWKNYAEDGDWWLTDEQEPADSCERSVPLYTHPTPPADLVDLVTILHQYRSDMLRPPAPDSRERRIAMIDAAIAKFGRDA